MSNPINNDDSNKDLGDSKKRAIQSNNSAEPRQKKIRKETKEEEIQRLIKEEIQPLKEREEENRESIQSLQERLKAVERDNQKDSDTSVTGNWFLRQRSRLNLSGSFIHFPLTFALLWGFGVFSAIYNGLV